MKKCHQWFDNWYIIILNFDFVYADMVNQDNNKLKVAGI